MIESWNLLNDYLWAGLDPVRVEPPDPALAEPLASTTLIFREHLEPVSTRIDVFPPQCSDAGQWTCTISVQHVGAFAAPGDGPITAIWNAGRIGRLYRDARNHGWPAESADPHSAPPLDPAGGDYAFSEHIPGLGVFRLAPPRWAAHHEGKHTAWWCVLSVPGRDPVPICGTDPVEALLMTSFVLNLAIHEGPPQE